MFDPSSVTWFSEPFTSFRGAVAVKPPPKVIGSRPMEHSDIPFVTDLIRPETYDLFGDVELAAIYEASCLSIVQHNAMQDVLSGICLCNYPNVPSVPSYDWLAWLKSLYGLESVTEMNTLFVHFLVWDGRYSDNFFADLLTELFDVASYCLHVILVLPPRVTPADVFHRQMSRVLAKNTKHTDPVQSLYVTTRHPSLRIRRVVEEDNDDVIPIIDAESDRLKEFYGEYYISEITRYKDDCRELIVSEDEDGLATGVMCLNRVINVDTLNENFELTPYRGLRKPLESDTSLVDFKPPSEIFSHLFGNKTEEFVQYENNLDTRSSCGEYTDEYEDIYLEENLYCENDITLAKNTLGITLSDHTLPRDMKIAPDRAEPVVSNSNKEKARYQEQKYVDSSLNQSPGGRPILGKSENNSQFTFLEELPSIADYLNLHVDSRMRANVFLERELFEFPSRSTTIFTKPSEVDVLVKEMQEILLHKNFQGGLNAFALEIFATKLKVKERGVKDFLTAAFECFKNLDYCVVLVPFSHPYISFLDHFVHVPLRPNRDFPMTLYITHRAVLFGDIKCCKADIEQLEQVEYLIKSIPKGEKIIEDFMKAVAEQSNLECYVFKCDNTIIGFTILRYEDSADYLKRRYHIEDYVSLQYIPQDSHKCILHFVVMPIFLNYQRQFLREIMRLSGSMILYYRLYDTDTSALTRTKPLATCLSSMVPATPRRRIEYRFRGYIEADEINRDEEVFSLFLTTPRLTTLPISVSHMKLVIVGASDCGVALAEYLTFRAMQYSVCFVNVTLISNHGLPFDKKQSGFGSQMIPFKGRYSQEYRQHIAARAFLNVVCGTVVGIHRKQKYVTVMNQGNLTYDYLILTCGLQYQKPIFEDEIQAQRKGEVLDRVRPWNCLTVNDDTEAAISLEKIRVITENLQEKKIIIFYGHNIDCYCALYGLLEFGVEGSWITIVEPPLHHCENHDDVFFSDTEIDNEVMAAIARSGVKTLFGWNLVNWNLKDTDKDKIIESIILESKGERIVYPCDVLFNFDEKTINLKSFLAICRAGLVFDGRLVIDPEYHTNDPHIFAAGTITKYSRRYYADSWDHRYYNSVEIGERLGEIIRKVIDTHQSSNQAPALLENGQFYLTPPVFRAPNIIACVLPGGYHYLNIRNAGKSIGRKFAIRHHFYGEVLVTGSCTSEIGYFRIRLNLLDTVETVTCFRKERFEVHHMIALYRLHESMLNNLKRRFRSSLIVDFYAYFREPWATALFYDRFSCMRIENRATLLSKTPIQGESLIEDCVQALLKSNWQTLPEETRENIEREFAGSIYHQDIEARLFDFLQSSEDDLPMYCTPKKFRWIRADIESSP